MESYLDAHADGARRREVRRHDLSRDLGRRPHRHRDGAALPRAPGRNRARPAARFLLRRSRRRAGEARALSFDMGGTTAKICLIDDYKPHTARLFEVDRAARFLKGSGLPVRIPVIEMVEIGAGGGSIARLDALKRITVGPESAGAEPGPACYGRGGTAARGDRRQCRAGHASIPTISPAAPSRSTSTRPRAPWSATSAEGARPVDRHGGLWRLRDRRRRTWRMPPACMPSSAARPSSNQYKLIAFGGAAPLHAARLAEKLGIRRVIVPPNAGVGSAVGFLRGAGRLRGGAQPLHAARRLRRRRPPTGCSKEMSAEADARWSRRRARPGDLRAPHGLHALCRPGPRDHGRAAATGRSLAADAHRCATAYERDYAALFERHIPNAAIEILSWTVPGLDRAPRCRRARRAAPARAAATAGRHAAGVRRPQRPARPRCRSTGATRCRRAAPLAGRPSIAEDETSTYHSASFAAHIDAVRLHRHGSQGRVRNTQ